MKWLVYGSSGSYEDRSVWTVCLRDSEEEARAIAADLEATAREWLGKWHRHQMPNGERVWARGRWHDPGEGRARRLIPSETRPPPEMDDLFDVLADYDVEGIPEKGDEPGSIGL